MGYVKPRHVAVGGRPDQRALAPGARVLIRDEEWLVRSQKSATYGGSAVDVVGLSELVAGKESIFLTGLDPVRELLPEETELTADTSSRYRRSRLYIEALLRRTPPTDDALMIGPHAAIHPTQYQLQPAARALRLPRPRLLFADGVGLGKTIEVGVLLVELIRRGRGRRILVVALKSILAQFQQELWSRFTIPLVRLDSLGIQRVQGRIPEGMNPFYHYDRVIISIDTLKKDAKYRRYLEHARWDVVVIDECQNVAVRAEPGSAKMSDRARLAQLLGRQSEALILTSATPHDGRASSFGSLIRLLEPTAVADLDNYSRAEVQDYFIRRFKKDVRYEMQEAFPDRQPHLLKQEASEEENAAFEALHTAEFRTIRRIAVKGRSGRGGRPGRGGKGVLFRTILLKGLLSSPAALRESISQRLRNLTALEERAEGSPDVAHDRRVLEELLALSGRIQPGAFSKYQSLLAWLKERGFDRRGNKERVVLFSERIATLTFLEERLRADLGLDEDSLQVFHGSMDDQRQMELVQSFGTAKSPLRILLASDVASEGINLHFQCHRLIHFDLPWSLITLEQRNGRIDRFGQTMAPELYYLLTIPRSSAIQGDLRVLERLIQKEDEAHRTLGDAAWLLNLHEAEAEEDHIAIGIDEGRSPEEVLPDEPAYTDLTDILFGGSAEREPRPVIGRPVRLYNDEYAYAREAVATALAGEEGERVDWHEDLKGLTIRPPGDLQRRFDYLPVELRRDGESLMLTTDRGRVMKALEDARQDPGRWPQWQLLWELHPVAGWLDDRVLATFSRHEAPVLRLTRGVAVKERVYLFQGMVSNQRSRPVLTDWFGVSFRGSGEPAIRTLEELVESTQLDKSPANPGGEIPEALMSALLAGRAEAVAVAQRHMNALRRDRAGAIGAPLREGLQKLADWRRRLEETRRARREQLMRKGTGVSRTEEKRLMRQKEEADRIYEEYRQWIDEGMRTVEAPYLRLAAVFVPVEE